MYKVNKDLLIRNLHFLGFASSGAGAGTSGGIGVVGFPRSCSLAGARLALCPRHRDLKADGEIFQDIFHFLAARHAVHGFPHLVFNLLHGLRHQTASGLRDHYLPLTRRKRVRWGCWSRRSRSRRGTGTPASADLLPQSFILRLQTSQTGGHVLHAHITRLNRRQPGFTRG